MFEELQTRLRESMVRQQNESVVRLITVIAANCDDRLDLPTPAVTR